MCCRPLQALHRVHKPHLFFSLAHFSAPPRATWLAGLSDDPPAEAASFSSSAPAGLRDASHILMTER